MVVDFVLVWLKLCWIDGSLKASSRVRVFVQSVVFSHCSS
jgi:hypothetical protein